MAAELDVNPNTPHILVGNNEEYIYLHNKPNRTHSLLAEEILLKRIGTKLVIYQNTVAGT